MGIVPRVVKILDWDLKLATHLLELALVRIGVSYEGSE